MAEKYGVVPPKFTKAWWSYFWDYYKWYVIGIGFAVICIAATAVQCATRREYDVTMTYAGQMVFDSEASAAVENAAAEYTEDIDGNGERAVFFQTLSISGASGQEEYDYALQMKLDLEFQNERSFVFLFDKSQLELMLARDYVNDLFVPLSEWAGDTGGRETAAGSDGQVYAVDVSDSGFFEDIGVQCPGTYAVLRRNTYDDGENKMAYDSAVELLRAMIGN